MKILASSKLTSKYQFTIPKKIRERVSWIKPGQKVQFELDTVTNQMIIKKQNSVEDLLGIVDKKYIDISSEKFDKIVTKQVIEDEKKNNRYKHSSKNNNKRQHSVKEKSIKIIEKG